MIGVGVDQAKGQSGLKGLKQMMDSAKVSPSAVVEATILADECSHLAHIRDIPGGEFRNLRKLNVRLGSGEGNQPAEFPAESIMGFQALKELKLHDVFLSFESDTRLIIEKVGYQSVVRNPLSSNVGALLQQAPCLTHLQIRGCNINLEEEQNVVTSESLTHLTIDFCDLEDCSAALASAQLPNLQHLSIAYFPLCSMAPCHHSFLVLRESNPLLRTLRLDMFRSMDDLTQENIDEQMPLLRYFPFIEQLKLIDIDVGSIASQMLWPSFVDAMTRMAQEDTPTIFPALKSIHFLDSPHFDMESVIQLVRKRQDMSVGDKPCVSALTELVFSRSKYPNFEERKTLKALVASVKLV